MLYTNLKHLDVATWYKDQILCHEKVLLICGSMDPESVQVYRHAEDLKDLYKEVTFFDMECDNPILNVFETLPIQDSDGEFPLIVTYKKGELDQLERGVLSKEALKKVLEVLISEQ